MPTISRRDREFYALSLVRVQSCFLPRRIVFSHCLNCELLNDAFTPDFIEASKSLEEEPYCFIGKLSNQLPSRPIESNG